MSELISSVPSVVDDILAVKQTVGQHPDPQFELTEIGHAALAAAAEAGATELPIVSRDYTHATPEELGRAIELLSMQIETLENLILNIVDHISRTRVLPQEAGEKEL